MTEDLPDGLYFELPEDAYHALPRLSASAMKWLRVSARDFWVRSWLNPEPEEEDEDSAAKAAGRAYHRRILEGPAAFARDYGPLLDQKDFPDAIAGNDAIREALRERALKLGGKKSEMINRLLLTAPHVQVWEELVRVHEIRNPGKILLDPKLMRRIERAAALIEKHPDLGKCVRGGYPEVSILFTDGPTGVKCKSRVDYLKPTAIVDLKSYSNAQGKPLDAAIRGAVANYGYYIQAAVYWRAVEHATVFAREGRVTGTVAPEFLKALADADPENRKFVFLFQDTGPAQVARGKVLPRHRVFDIGDTVARECLEMFAACSAAFGDGEWVDTAPIEEFDDMEFPPWLGQ